MLQITNCCLTDVGIKGLCSIGVDGFGNAKDRLGQCKSIHTLNVLGTQVTKKGIQMALDNLPAFKMFYFCSYIQILAELQQERKFKKHSLTSLWSDESSFCDFMTLGKRIIIYPTKVAVSDD